MHRTRASNIGAGRPRHSVTTGSANPLGPPLEGWARRRTIGCQGPCRTTGRIHGAGWAAYPGPSGPVHHGRVWPATVTGTKAERLANPGRAYNHAVQPSDDPPARIV